MTDARVRSGRGQQSRPDEWNLKKNQTGFPRLAAIRIADDTPTDYLLESAVRILQCEGKMVAGFIQRQGRQDLSGHAEMLLEEIPNGRRICISQPLGSEARGCRLDPQAIAETAGPFLAVLETKPDLLVLNRFGKGESEGQGFRAVFEKAFLLGIPVLTSVKQIYVGAWEAFADDCAVSLSPTLDSVLGWSRAVVTRSELEIEAAALGGSAPDRVRFASEPISRDW